MSASSSIATEVIIPFGLASMLVQAVICRVGLPEAVQHAARGLAFERSALRWRICTVGVVDSRHCRLPPSIR